MNAHFSTTKTAPDAKVSGSIVDLKLQDPAAIKIGELVYCRPNATNPDPKIEGVACVVRIKGQQFAAHDSMRDESSDLVWQDIGTISHHLPGYEFYHGRVPAGPRDEKLIQLGRWITALLPVERAMWAEVTEMRTRLDAISPTAYEADARYNNAIEKHSAEAGCALSLLTWAANHSHARTPAGHAARMAAVEHDVHQGFEIGDEALLQLTEEAQRVADFVQPQLTVGRTLAELIEAHRQTAQAFAAAVDKHAEASSAWDWKRAKNIYTTPVRLRDGKVVASIEVTGDVEDDRMLIDREHDRWAVEFALGKVKEVSTAAAKLIKEQVEASRSECHRIYSADTLPALKIARADFDAVDAEYHAAYEAEIAALDALNRYRPADLAEVGALTRYLLSTDFYSGCETAEFANQLMVTLSTLGTD